MTEENRSTLIPNQFIWVMNTKTGLLNAHVGAEQDARIPTSAEEQAGESGIRQWHPGGGTCRYSTLRVTTDRRVQGKVWALR